MNYKELLQEQLQLQFQKGKISLDGDILSIKGIPFKGIEIHHNEGLNISFMSFDVIDFKYLNTYFEPRLKFSETRIYYRPSSKSISVYVDKKFTKGNKGAFEKAMWFSEMIGYFIKEIEDIISKVILE